MQLHTGPHPRRHAKQKDNRLGIGTKPAADFDRCIGVVNQIKDMNGHFLSWIIEARETYLKEYVMAGTPWTPWLKRTWKKEMQTALPARKLFDIAKTLPPGAEPRLRWRDGRCQITAGRSRFTLGTLPTDDFPVIEPIDPADPDHADMLRLNLNLRAHVCHYLPRSAVKPLLRHLFSRLGMDRQTLSAVLIDLDASTDLDAEPHVRELTYGQPLQRLIDHLHAAGVAP